MVRSPRLFRNLMFPATMFVGGLLVGAAITAGAMSHRSDATPATCNVAPHRAPDASILPPEPLGPSDGVGAFPAAGTVASPGGDATSPTVR